MGSYSDPEWKALARVIKEAAEWVCFYCGGPANSVDHVVPKTLGGTDHPTNLVCACSWCNGVAAATLFDSVHHKKLWLREQRGRVSYYVVSPGAFVTTIPTREVWLMMLGLSPDILTEEMRKLYKEATVARKKGVLGKTKRTVEICRWNARRRIGYHRKPAKNPRRVVR